MKIKLNLYADNPCDSFNLYPTEQHKRDKFSFYNQCLASLLWEQITRAIKCYCFPGVYFFHVIICWAFKYVWDCTCG